MDYSSSEDDNCEDDMELESVKGIVIQDIGSVIQVMNENSDATCVTKVLLIILD